MVRQKINAFLKQSVHSSRNTPGIKHPYDHDHHLDGFGFAWLSPSLRWKKYKKTCVYLEDSQLSKKLDEIVESSVIIGHLRNKLFGDKEIDNTHPFSHENQIFVHNGFLRNFGEHKAEIKRKISAKYKHCIRGSTDTEYLFYLFLTIKDRIRTEHGLPEGEALLMKSMTGFFDLLNSMKMELYANFIFANKTHVLITRYVLNTKPAGRKANADIPPLPLYYSTMNGIVISSEPIMEDYHIVPENSVVIIELNGTV
jgi:glutamine amidotransferase